MVSATNVIPYPGDLQCQNVFFFKNMSSFESIYLLLLLKVEIILTFQLEAQICDR